MFDGWKYTHRVTFFFYSTTPFCDNTARSSSVSTRLTVVPPVKRAVVHAVLAIEMVEIRLNVGFNGVGIDMADMEKHGRGLDKAEFLVAHFERNAGSGRHIAVAGGIDNDLGFDGLDPGFGRDLDAGDGMTVQHRLEEGGMIHNLDADLFQHLVQHQFQPLRLERGDMIVPDLDPRGKAGATHHLTRMDGKTTLDHAVDDLFKNAANDHVFALRIVAGHERADQPHRRHTAAASALFDQQHLHTLSCGGDRRAYAGRTAANHQNIGFVVHHNISKHIIYFYSIKIIDIINKGYYHKDIIYYSFGGGLVKRFADCRYLAINAFKIERGYPPKHSLLFVVSGEIAFDMNGTRERVGADTLISFPEQVYFERSVPTPCEFYYVRYENPDNDPLPIGKISIDNTGRLLSTLQYLLKLNGVAGHESLKDGLLADIFHQMEAEALLDSIQNDRIVTLVSRYFEKHIAEKIALADAAAAAGLSASGLIYHFKKQTGTTPIEYLTAMRLQKAEVLLCQTGDSVAQIAAVCGFDNPYYFSNTFKKHRGLSPTAYRLKHGI